jgi:hypothetical protein
VDLSRKSATIFGMGTIPEPSTSHIGKGAAPVAQTTAFVYIYARIPQIAEMTLSFHAIGSLLCWKPILDFRNLGMWPFFEIYPTVRLRVGLRVGHQSRF